ncbi:homeobox-domain-containing protein [Rhizopus microsporus var. microsporus]|uniref:Homeobox-domain-containing protein n=2 Tax=Rhizopus microsporus TaxID=58291 RepID=A0A2G4SH20_RHIZD|nr:homeobox-domain-containing protein [Rhizopus microsporus ATCC 52813]ORE06462.1 homeobox-domain-containing protein [Rhizopus microsporus var. microsporus]PHZ08068.1 homeobox-domain-containing protein [Rhizopus microsporus ATCC 52813]
MQKNKRLSISSLLNDNGINEEQQPKTKRKRITPAQYNRLMEIFDQTDTPSSEIRENLATELDMTKREVQVWFQNRRAKLNRESKQRRMLLQQQQQQQQQQQHPLLASNEMSPIDLLASAAEFVQIDQQKRSKKGV